MRSLNTPVYFMICLSLTSRLFAQSQATLPTNPRVVGYLSLVVPVVTMDKNTITTNFSTTKTLCFPVGLSVLYSDRFGFSFEIAPTIKITDTNSKVSNFLFDPGPMFRFKKGFTIIPRLAFETSGRYGFTPVFNQIIRRTKTANYFAAVSLPARFGNNAPSSIGLNFQLGLIFN